MLIDALAAMTEKQGSVEGKLEVLTSTLKAVEGELASFRSLKAAIQKLRDSSEVLTET